MAGEIRRSTRGLGAPQSTLALRVIPRYHNRHALKKGRL